jgi:hypothetical protein
MSNPTEPAPLRYYDLSDLALSADEPRSLPNLEDILKKQYIDQLREFEKPPERTFPLPPDDGQILAASKEDIKGWIDSHRKSIDNAIALRTLIYHSSAP